MAEKQKKANKKKKYKRTVDKEIVFKLPLGTEDLDTTFLADPVSSQDTSLAEEEDQLDDTIPLQEVGNRTITTTTKDIGHLLQKEISGLPAGLQSDHLITFDTAAIMSGAGSPKIPGSGSQQRDIDAAQQQQSADDQQQGAANKTDMFRSQTVLISDITTRKDQGEESDDDDDQDTALTDVVRREVDDAVDRVSRTYQQQLDKQKDMLREQQERIRYLQQHQVSESGPTYEESEVIRRNLSKHLRTIDEDLHKKQKELEQELADVERQVQGKVNPFSSFTTSRGATAPRSTQNFNTSSGTQNSISSSGRAQNSGGATAPAPPSNTSSNPPPNPPNPNSPNNPQGSVTAPSQQTTGREQFSLEQVIKIIQAANVGQKNPDKLVTPPIFSGKPGERAEDHLLRASDWLEHCQVPIEDRVRDFKLTLSGKARTWYNDLTFPMTWAELQLKFERAFSSQGRSPALLHERWRQMTFNPDVDDIEDYLRDLKQTAKQLGLSEEAIISAILGTMPKHCYPSLYSIKDLSMMIETLKGMFGKHPQDKKNLEKQQASSPFNLFNQIVSHIDGKVPQKEQAPPETSKPLLTEDQLTSLVQLMKLESSPSRSLNAGNKQTSSSGAQAPRRPPFKPYVFPKGSRGKPYRGYPPRGVRNNAIRGPRQNYRSSYRGGKIVPRNPPKPDKDNRKAIDRDANRCFHCKQFGHWKKDCPELQNDGDSKEPSIKVIRNIASRLHQLVAEPEESNEEEEENSYNTDDSLLRLAGILNA